jgi:hypothetical protein
MPATVKTKISRALARKRARAFGVTCTAKQIATLGVWGERTVYDMLRAGTFPIEPIRVGSHYRVPTAPLLKYLGLED